MENFEQKTLANISIVRQLTNQLGGGLQKSFGQNFLINQNSLLKFVNSLKPTIEDIVIEIGPGIGVVSYTLCDVAKKVYLIEIDRNKEPALQKVLENYSNYEIIWADGANFDYSIIIKKILEENPDFNCKENLKIIGSLPYNVSKKIIYNLFNSDIEWSITSFFLQKEVADSYASTPPQAEFLGTFARIYADVSLLFMVDPKHFIPIPKVKTWVIQFKQHDIYKDIQRSKFSSFIKTGFAQPRKTVTNNLKGLQITGEDLATLGFKPSARPSELNTGQWYKIYQLFLERQKVSV